jgi:hypothetical protein
MMEAAIHSIHILLADSLAGYLGGFFTSRLRHTTLSRKR